MRLPTVGLLLIKERKLLLAFSNNKKCFYLPGGKVDPGESVSEALCREIAEELAIQLSESELRYYTHISAPAFGETEGMVMEQDCFFASTHMEPSANGEIADIRYFSLDGYMSEPTRAPGVVMILEQLRADDYID